MIDPVTNEDVSPITEAGAIERLVLGAQRQPVVLELPEGRTVIGVPTSDGGFEIEDHTSPHKADVLLPKVTSQNVVVQTAGSMVTYLNRFKNSDSLLFADVNANAVIGIIDYHEKSVDGEPVKAKLGKHSVSLKLPFSQEWQTWSANSGKLLSHVEFATFLEENAIDIIAPRGGDLLTICRDLQVKSNMDFTTSVRMGDTTKIEFQKGDDVSTKDNLELPVQITISIPVYFGERPVEVTCFLRRKINEKQLYLGYVMSRVENIRQGEFHRVTGYIVDGTTEYDDDGVEKVAPLTMVAGRPS